MALSVTSVVEVEYTAGVWTDETSRVQSWRITRGKSQRAKSYDAGTATVVFNNADRRFDPTYAAGPLFGNLLPRRRIRIGVVHNATTYYRFYGFVDGWPQSYQPPNHSTVVVRATDAFKLFSRQQLPSAWRQGIESLSPQFWARCGDRTGAIASDSSENANHGVINGEINTVSSLLLKDNDAGYAFYSGEGTLGAPTSTFRLVYPATAGLSGSSITVRASFTTDQLVASSGPTVPIAFQTSNGQAPQYIDAGGSGPFDYNFNGWWLGYVNTGSDALYLHFAVSDGNGNYRHISTNVFPGIFGRNKEDGSDTFGSPPGTVFDICATNSAGTLAIYYDGAAYTTMVRASAGSAPSIAQGKVFIGSGNTSDGVTEETGRTYPWPGTIDEVVGFNSALSAGEVSDLHDLTRNPWGGDTASERIDRVLDYVSWSGSARDLDAGSGTLLMAELETTVLDHLHTVEESQGGHLFVDRNGNVRFVGRSNFAEEAVYRTSQGTFGDGPGQLPFSVHSSELFDYSDQHIVNEARIEQQDGTSFFHDDSTSKTTYGVAGYTARSVDASAAAVKNQAEWKVNANKDPRIRLNAVTLKPESNPSAMYPVVLASDLGYRYTFEMTPQSVGSAISEEVTLSRIDESMTAAGDFTVEWETVPAEPKAFLWETADHGWEDGAWIY